MRKIIRQIFSIVLVLAVVIHIIPVSVFAADLSDEPSRSTPTGEVGTVLDEITYLYGNDSWGDLLTSYDGRTITYDTIGNPLNDGIWTYTWEQGRQLTTMTSGSTTWTYSYGTDGLRTQRSDGSTTYRYWYNHSGLLLRMEKGSTVYSFTYDPAGRPVSVTEGDTRYYYVLNQQGDVVGLINGNKDLVVEYFYDAWGRIFATIGTAANTLGANNPLRYRGYVYDSETGLYYLQNRYYNPTWGRFINADNYLSTGRGILGYNMFAYCNNNPVIYVDTVGQFPWLVTAFLIASALIGGGMGAASDRKLINPSESGTLTLGDRIENFFVGAALGLAAGGAVVASAGVAGSFAIGSALHYIPLFGLTGLKTFAIGSLAYNVVAIIVAPFLGIEMEPIEYEGK